MTIESKIKKQEHPRTKVVLTGASEVVYGLGLIGALVYYIGHAATFWLGAFGVLKAIV